jgi:hypothetical protein
MNSKPWNIAKLSLIIGVIGSLPIIAITGSNYLGYSKSYSLYNPTLIISGLCVAFGLIGFMIGIQKDKAYLESNYGQVPSSNGIFISPFYGLLNYYDERKKIVEEV